PGEMGLEYLAVEIGFLRLRSLHRKTLGGSAHHAVRDFTPRGGLHPVAPAVSDAVGKLLLLPPQHGIRNVTLERFSKRPLLNGPGMFRVSGQFKLRTPHTW